MNAMLHSIVAALCERSGSPRPPAGPSPTASRSRSPLAAWEFVDGPLRDNPRRAGHALAAPFEGYWSARRGTYRVRYRIDEDERVVIVLDIAPRADAYDPGRAPTNG
jgi:mRNA interferase RelE/StbE